MCIQHIPSPPQGPWLLTRLLTPPAMMLLFIGASIAVTAMVTAGFDRSIQAAGGFWVGFPYLLLFQVAGLLLLALGMVSVLSYLVNTCRLCPPSPTLFSFGTIALEQTEGEDASPIWYVREHDICDQPFILLPSTKP